MISTNVDDQKNFFRENLDALKSTFNALEMNDIKVLVTDNKTVLNIQAVLSAKPLQNYINLFDDKDFFDIVNNEYLTFHFQPIIDMRNNTIYGYETLARGVKEDGSLMYPNELFAKSNRNDLNFKAVHICISEKWK